MKPYRNKKLLDLAEHAPCCMYCGDPNHGQVVPCHFNAIKYGKGTGQKAHDIVAYLCDRCHAIADGRMKAAVTDKRDRELILYDGIYRTFLWLLQEGHLKTS